MLTSDNNPVDHGEIHNRWAKRAAAAIASNSTSIRDWLDQGPYDPATYEQIAHFVLNAATTGNGS